MSFYFFFFNDTATTEIYTLSLHDALPISSTITTRSPRLCKSRLDQQERLYASEGRTLSIDRKSTRLNSSHANISYAVFCLKKKKNKSEDNEGTSDRDQHKARNFVCSRCKD